MRQCTLACTNAAILIASIVFVIVTGGAAIPYAVPTILASAIASAVHLDAAVDP
jgi:hypothetical protein